jgi:D-3-phosphoglycerate dehydrogenase
MSTKILLSNSTESLPRYYGERALNGLQALGEVILNPYPRPFTPAELIAAAAGCRIIVSDRATAGDPQIFQNLPELIAFCRCAVDIRTIDVDAASAAGVLITRASPGFIPSVAELVLGFMIDLSRRITVATSEYRSGKTAAAVMGGQLNGATAGIIGYGAISRYLCDLLLALGMKVLVSDPYTQVEQGRANLNQTTLPELLAQADYVVCLAIANAETENLMNAEAFAQMKKSAYFINVSRGNLVDEAALIRVLDEKRIAGAALDVGRAADQMPSPELAGRADVIATPHIGGLTPKAIEHQALETVEQVAAILQGQIPKGAVNVERAGRLRDG